MEKKIQQKTDALGSSFFQNYRFLRSFIYLFGKQRHMTTHSLLHSHTREDHRFSPALPFTSVSFPQLKKTSHPPFDNRHPPTRQGGSTHLQHSGSPRSRLCILPTLSCLPGGKSSMASRLSLPIHEMQSIIPHSTELLSKVCLKRYCKMRQP